MPIISKHAFEEILSHGTCRETLHPHMGCIHNMRYVFLNSIIGSIKLYVPIYILQLIIANKNIKKPLYLKTQAKYFVKSVLYGATMATVLCGTTCVLRHILGRFYYNSAVFVPGFCSGLSIFWENSNMKLLNTYIFSALTLECCVLLLKDQKIIKNTITSETMYFMFSNALFTYLYKTNALANKVRLVWFFDPRPKNEENVLQCCTEKYKCFKHILLDVRNTFGTGYAFYVVKKLVSKMGKIIKNPIHIFSTIFNKDAMKNGLFFGSYIFIYEIISRFLYGLQGEKNIHSLIAGFLAGVSYSINPNLQMNMLPTIFVLQLLWLTLCDVYNIPKWCFREIFFCFLTGILYHFRFLIPECSPAYLKFFVDCATNSIVSKYHLIQMGNLINKEATEKGLKILYVP